MIYLKYNNEKIKKWQKQTFPNKETIYKRLDKAIYEIVIKYESDVDIFDCFMLCAQNENVESVYFTYFPYARMDRGNDNFSCSLDAIAGMLSPLKLNITILDPHSRKTKQYIEFLSKNKVSEKYIHEELINIIGFVNSPIIHYPDEGAKKKYSKKYSVDYFSYGIKRRNFNTGRIESLEIVGDIKDKDIFIIDDICSYGGTFTLTYEKLKEKGANKIYLLVTHCEDSILKGKCLNLLDGVYTTNSIFTKSHEKIKVLDLFKDVE